MQGRLGENDVMGYIRKIFIKNKEPCLHCTKVCYWHGVIQNVNVFQTNMKRLEK